MGFAIQTITKSGNSDCHKQMLPIIKTLAEANGWTTIKYDNSSINHELYLKGVGLSGSEEIFVGFRTYEDSSADYYNILCATFSGYNEGIPFKSQAGYIGSAVYAHNNAITYFLTINAQRIALCMKVGTPVYSHAYVGKIFPYAKPSEYPMALLTASHEVNDAAVRFSAGKGFAYYGQFSGYNFTGLTGGRIRKPDGNAGYFWAHPFSGVTSAPGNCTAGGNQTLVPIDGVYQIEPVVIGDAPTGTSYIPNNLNPANIYGELDGIYFISGFDNASENVVQMGGTSIVDQTGKTTLQCVTEIKAANGRAFVMLQSMNATGFRDFIAMEMN